MDDDLVPLVMRERRAAVVVTVNIMTVLDAILLTTLNNNHTQQPHPTTTTSDVFLSSLVLSRGTGGGQTVLYVLREERICRGMWDTPALFQKGYSPGLSRRYHIMMNIRVDL